MARTSVVTTPMLARVWKKRISWLARASGLRRITLLRWLYHRLLYMTLPDRDMTVPCHGLQMLVRNPRTSTASMAIYLTGVWEDAATRLVSSEVAEGMIALDVGASDGYYTLLMSQLVGAGGHVFAFEPLPTDKGRLDRNISVNGLGNVTTCRSALFDRNATACLEVSNTRLAAAQLAPLESTVPVETRIFDDWRRDTGVARVDFVKVDVEGAEMNVLRGMTSTLESDRPMLLVEVHPTHLSTFDSSPRQLVRFVSELGYQIKPVDKDTIEFSEGNSTLFCH